MPKPAPAGNQRGYAGGPAGVGNNGGSSSDEEEEKAPESKQKKKEDWNYLKQTLHGNQGEMMVDP